jgi:uncharacterized membrane-anchored protein
MGVARGPQAAQIAAMNDHPLRKILNDDVHSRPGLPVATPARISHLAFTLSPGDGDPLPAIQALCAAKGIAPPAAGALHLGVVLKDGLFKYERHGEFYRVSITIHDTRKEGVDWLPSGWLATLPGQRIVAIHTHVLAKEAKAPKAAQLKALFDSGEIACSRVNQGKTTVWSDFRIGEDGYTRMLIHDGSGSPARLGRLTRRLHEIETYRMMALLALPLARGAQGTLKRLEAELSATIDGMAGHPRSEDASLLQRLISLSRDIESLSDQTSYRFAAARAYAALVGKRIAELGEERVENHQRLGVFLERRFTPAIATCAAVESRLSSLAQRCERASNLLRTRVDIALEGQNQALLQSMEKRARQQLMLQETVEGLSVAAISYYVIGIVGKLIEGAGKFAVFDEKLAQFVSIPLVIAAVWLAGRHIKKKVQRAAGE